METVAKIGLILRFLAHQSVRLSVAALGFTVLTVGLVLLVTPGPGLLVIIGGLAILAHEFAWAATALEKAKARAAQAREAALRRAPRRNQNSSIRRYPPTRG